MRSGQNNRSNEHAEGRTRCTVWRERPLDREFCSRSSSSNSRCDMPFGRFGCASCFVDDDKERLTGEFEFELESESLVAAAEGDDLLDFAALDALAAFAFGDFGDLDGLGAGAAAFALELGEESDSAAAAAGGCESVFATAGSLEAAAATGAEECTLDAAAGASSAAGCFLGRPRLRFGASSPFAAVACCCCCCCWCLLDFFATRAAAGFASLSESESVSSSDASALLASGLNCESHKHQLTVSRKDRRTEQAKTAAHQFRFLARAFAVAP